MTRMAHDNECGCGERGEAEAALNAHTREVHDPDGCTGPATELRAG